MAIKNLRKPLTERARAFCREYVENGYNGKRAYMAAYQNENEATSQVGSYQLLKDPRVMTEISFLEGTYKSLSYKVGLTKELVVKTLVDMMNANRTISKKDGTFEIVPDWYARNNAISQYSKLTGDFNEKNKAVDEVIAKKQQEEEERGVSLSGLSKEDLEVERQRILANISSGMPSLN